MLWPYSRVTRTICSPWGTHGHIVKPILLKIQIFSSPNQLFKKKFWPFIICYHSYQNTIILNGRCRSHTGCIPLCDISLESWVLQYSHMRCVELWLLYTYIIIGILTVNIRIITVKLTIIIFIYTISQFHMRHWNAEYPQLSNDVSHNSVHPVFILY